MPGKTELPGETAADVSEHALLRRLEGQSRRDSWSNFQTGVGVPGADKRLAARVHLQRMTYWQCADLYRANDMAARAVDAMPDECARKGFTFAVAGKPEIAEALDHSLKALNAIEAFRQAHKFSRAYGGGAIFIGANDKKTADQPLVEENIQSIDFLLPVDTQELVPASYYGYDDLLAGLDGSKYGKPKTYIFNRYGSISGTGLFGGAVGGLEKINAGVFEKTTSSGGLGSSPVPVIHESRIMRFEGIFINRVQQREQRSWGDPIFFRMQKVIRDFDLTWDSAALLIADFAQAVVKMKGFSALVSSQGPSIIASLAASIDRSRSSGRMLMLDSEDEFERKATPITGLPDLIDRFCNRLAASVPMPVTKLMGQSPAGLNATGDQDDDWWTDEVGAEQMRTWGPNAERLGRLLLLAKNGVTKGKLPKTWSSKFHPLKQIDPAKEATRRKDIAATDDLYIKNQVVTPEEVAVTRFGGDEFNDGKIQLSELDPEKRALAAQEAAEEKARLGGGDGSADGSSDGSSDGTTDGNEGDDDEEPEGDGTGG